MLHTRGCFLVGNLEFDIKNMVGIRGQSIYPLYTSTLVVTWAMMSSHINYVAACVIGQWVCIFDTFTLEITSIYLLS